MINMNPLEVNVLVLAYLGDSIYENYIRIYLVEKGINNVKKLQEEAIKYVSAKSQTNYLIKMIDSSFLSENELRIVKRARNCKVKHHPKNCDITTYNYSTGFEALIGYLFLDDNKKRIEEIIDYILEE